MAKFTVKYRIYAKVQTTVTITGPDKNTSKTTYESTTPESEDIK